MTPGIVAPEHWRTIDFISDLHLSADAPATVQAWHEHLLHTPADAVFMLGDLFELWVGDDSVAQPFEAACARTLAAAAERCSLAFLVGNRDFLLGPAMARASRMQLLDEPVVVQAFGVRTLLCHGDALCIADSAYQRFRSVVRSPGWQNDFLARALPERLAFAASLRSHSEQRKRLDSAVEVDVDASLAAQWLGDAHASVMVHGHTHRPGSHALPRGLTRHVLSDWDLDHGSPARAEVLRWTSRGFERVVPSNARS